MAEVDSEKKTKPYSKLTPEMEEKIYALLSAGIKKKTVIAKKVGVTDDTIRNWIKSDIEFAKKYNRAFDIYLLSNAPSVKASLLKRANGYNYVEKKIVYAANSQGDAEIVSETHKTVHIPAEVNAIKMYLTNLLSEDYE